VMASDHSGTRGAEYWDARYPWEVVGECDHRGCDRHASLPR
jgi:hypothetical protein